MKIISPKAKSILIVTLIFGVATMMVIQKNRSQPRFEGQTMDWWLDQFATDRVLYVNNSPALSHHQLKSVHAFKKFDKQGFDFLAKVAGLDTRSFSISEKTIQLLNQISWVKKQRFFISSKKRSLAALHLIQNLNFPLEWLEAYLPLPLSSQSPLELNLSLSLVRHANNRKIELIRKLFPFLGGRYEFVTLISLDALYVNQPAIPEMEEHLQKVSPRFQTYPHYCRLLSRHANHPGFARSKLMELADNSNPAIAARALLALGSTPTTQEEAHERLSHLLHNTHIKQWREKTNDIILSDIFDEEKLWLQASSEIQQLGVNYLMDRIRDSISFDLENEPEMFWILSMAPDHPELWGLYDRIQDTSAPVEIAHNLRMLGSLTTTSHSAINRLRDFAASNHTPYAAAATEALDMLRLKGLIPNNSTVKPHP